jgi:ATP-dependent helicase/nuclease subunit A
MSQASHSEFRPFLAVHASAGSGKTYLLVSRIIRLLLNGARPGGILSITFTRKAAAEMQERLLSRIKAMATMPDDQLDKTLQELGVPADDAMHRIARQLYENVLHADYPVRTTTFHAFCQDLLRRFPMEANIPPGFELVERTGQLIDEAWEAYANSLTRQPNSEIAKAMDVLLKELGLYNTQVVLNAFLDHRSDWWALTWQQAAPVEFALGLLTQQLPEATDDPVNDFLSDKNTINQLNEFIALLNLNPTKTNKGHANDIEQSLQTELDCASRFEFVWYAFFTKSGDAPIKRKSGPTVEKKMGNEGARRYLELHDLMCDALISVRRSQHVRDTLVLTRAWLLCGENFLAHFNRIKSSQRILDFADLEWKSFELLNAVDHADWIQYKLDQRIEHLLIDEFQDTNPVHWQLVLPLLEELAASEDKRQRSVLFVGDSKQSIYRFRRAEPKLFDAATHWLQQKVSAQVSTLTKSWRSSPAITEFVNRIFTENTDLSLPHFEHHQTEHTDLWGKVTLLPLAVTDDKARQVELRDPLVEPRDEKEHGHYLEAQIIAREIKALVEKPLILGKDADSRPVDYSHIMILFRSRTHANEYERALREAHIPYLGTERGTLLESLEVSDMVNLLKWLTTPFDDLALAGILRSPLFATSSVDLLLLAGKKNWFEQLCTLATTLEAGHPFARAAMHLQNWLDLADKLPVHDLLDRIYSEANVLARYRAAFPQHLHSRVMANLTRFLELALENDSGRYPSLTRFIAWLKILRQQDREAPDQPSGLAGQARVRLLTVHEAKGLEAPVVFVADATSKPRSDVGTRVLVNWPGETLQPEAFFLSPSSKYPNKFSEAIVNDLEDKAKQEEANLLYVALTRAQQLLYISGSGKMGGWYESICKACFPDENIPELPVDVEQANTPAELQQAKVAPTRITPEVDPRLQQPLTIQAAYREIAPSYSISGTMLHHAEPDEDARTRGIVIHNLLEQLANDPAITLDKALIRSGHNRSAECDSWWQEAREVIATFPEFFNPERYTKAMSEVPICYMDKSDVVNGIIDRLVIYTDRICVIDYKTHRVTDKQHMQTLKEEYQEQLLLYRDGIQKIYTDLPVEACLLFTANGTCEYLAFD